THSSQELSAPIGADIIQRAAAPQYGGALPLPPPGNLGWRAPAEFERIAVATYLLVPRVAVPVVMDQALSPTGL
ncbi:MAG: hypothetical protein ACI8PT_003386, partial [Gammaproteobacteria bacterium]